MLAGLTLCGTPGAPFPTAPSRCAFLLQEVEQQYKEGSTKHAIVAVLKSVQPDALTAQGAVACILGAACCQDSGSECMSHERAPSARLFPLCRHR